MWNSRKSVILSLILTYVFMILLVIGMIALPMLVTWYVEYKGREASLPTTIMLTLYPCAPFAAVWLWSLRNVIKGVLDGTTFSVKTAKELKKICWCSFGIMAIMIFSGQYYLPFFVCAMCAGFIGLILMVIKNIIEENTAAEEISDSTEKLQEDNKETEAVQEESEVTEAKEEGAQDEV